MKQKELKALAKRIAQAEKKLSLCEDKKERKIIEAAIMELSSHVSSLEEMCILDDMVRSLLEQS